MAYVKQTIGINQKLLELFTKYFSQYCYVCIKELSGQKAQHNRKCTHFKIWEVLVFKWFRRLSENIKLTSLLLTLNLNTSCRLGFDNIFFYFHSKDINQTNSLSNKWESKLNVFYLSLEHLNCYRNKKWFISLISSFNDINLTNIIL